jgi:hypothetical protein
MKCLFSKNNVGNQIDDFKTTTVAVFGLFRINKNDSAAFFTTLELAGSTNVNFDAGEFSIQYCGTHFELFLYLWNKYRLAVHNHSKPVGSAQINPTYQQFMCFLLFFMSIPDVDLVRWMYWLHFAVKKIVPDNKTLIALVDTLWGRDDALSFKRKHCKASVERLLQGIEQDELCPNKVRVVDIRSRGAWSKPLVKLRNNIRRNSSGRMSSYCWARLGVAVRNSSVDFPIAYERLRDHWIPSLWGLSDYIVVGERRAARKTLRHFLRSYVTYLEMPLDTEFNTLAAQATLFEDDIESTSNSRLGIFFSSAGNIVGRMSRDAQIFPLTSGGVAVTQGSAKNMPLFLWPFRRKRSAMRKYVPTSSSARRRGADDQSLASSTPLEVVYKSALTAPIATVYAQAHDAQNRAKQMLALCQEEIDIENSNELFALLHHNSVSTIQTTATQRKVSHSVVEVSDNSVSSRDIGSASGSQRSCSWSSRNSPNGSVSNNDTDLPPGGKEKKMSRSDEED